MSIRAASSSASPDNICKELRKACGDSADRAPREHSKTLSGIGLNLEEIAKLDLYQSMQQNLVVLEASAGSKQGSCLHRRQTGGSRPTEAARGLHKAQIYVQV